MSVKDLLAKITSGDTDGIQDMFEAIMAQKASDKIDELRIATAQTMFSEGKTPFEQGKEEKEAEDAAEEDDDEDNDGKDAEDAKDTKKDKADDSEDDSDDDSEDAKK